MSVNMSVAFRRLTHSTVIQQRRFQTLQLSREALEVLSDQKDAIVTA